MVPFILYIMVFSNNSAVGNVLCDVEYSLKWKEMRAVHTVTTITAIFASVL